MNDAVERDCIAFLAVSPQHPKINRGWKMFPVSSRRRSAAGEKGSSAFPFSSTINRTLRLIANQVLVPICNKRNVNQTNSSWIFLFIGTTTQKLMLVKNNRHIFIVMSGIYLIVPFCYWFRKKYIFAYLRNKQFSKLLHSVEILSNFFSFFTNFIEIFPKYPS